MVLGDLIPVENTLEGEEILSQTINPIMINSIIEDRTKNLMQKINNSERSAEEIREVEAPLDELCWTKKKLGRTQSLN